MTNQRDKDNEIWEIAGSQADWLDKLVTGVNPFLTTANRNGYENGVAHPAPKPSFLEPTNRFFPAVEAKPKAAPASNAPVEVKPTQPASPPVTSSASFIDDDDDRRSRRRRRHHEDEREVSEFDESLSLHDYEVGSSSISFVSFKFRNQEERDKHDRKMAALYEVSNGQFGTPLSGGKQNGSEELDNISSDLESGYALRVLLAAAKIAAINGKA